MSFTRTEQLKEWAKEALAPHAAALLGALENQIEDATYLAIEPVLGGSAVMKEAVDSYPVKDASPARETFMLDLHHQYGGLVKVLTPKQCRAVANHLRLALRMEDGWKPTASYEAGPASSPTPAPAAPKPPHWDKETKTYRCFTCNENCTGLEALYRHREKEHGIRPPAKYATPSPTSPAAVAPPTALAAFTPKLDLDLSVLPSDGRYAILPTVENGYGSPRFVLIKQVRRPYSRRGRFIWGASRRGYAEYIEKGRWEVRVQSGDTKELIGEQKASNVYHGEMEELIQEVLANPAEAMKQYGVLLGVCSYCGRSLTDELSRLRGIGPDCWENKHMPFISRRALALKASV